MPISLRPYIDAYKWTIWIALLLAIATGYVSAQVVLENGNEELQKIDVVEHLGDRIPLDLTVTADDGRTVKLREFFDGEHPVALTLGYYECPMLCNLVFNGLAEGVKQLDWLPGEDFRMLTVSINPEESYELAYAKKVNYLKSMEKDLPDSAWTFCTAAGDQSKALANALGFKYFYDESQDQYAHPAVLFLLSPDGTISRYLYGIDFKKQDLKLGLLEASEGRIGNTVDRIVLYCFHYDPDAKGYTVFAGNVMRLGGATAVVVLGSVLGLLWVGERRRSKRRRNTSECVRTPTGKS